MSTDCTESCSQTCDNLPQVDFSLCAPKVYFGLISNVFITSRRHPLVDETDANEWALRIALNYRDPSRIINLTGIGDKPEPESVEEVAAFANNFYSHKNHFVNFLIYQLADPNYNMMRVFEKEKKVLVWYLTSSGILYGGLGIPATIGFNQVIPGSASDLESLKGIVKWKGKIHPCRTLSPI